MSSRSLVSNDPAEPVHTLAASAPRRLAVWRVPVQGRSALVRDELSELWLLRHGQSLGNVANERARENPVDRLDIAERDMDVPLSDVGRAQAAAVGRWLGSLPANERPDVVVSSPYLRAVQTAELALATA